jgi:hypothetical protein
MTLVTMMTQVSYSLSVELISVNGGIGNERHSRHLRHSRTV